VGVDRITPVGAAEGCESDISASTGSPPLAAPTKKLIAIHIVAIFLIKSMLWQNNPLQSSRQ
jgi:hypothetical protein